MENILNTLKEQFRNPPNRYRTLQIIHNFDSFGSDEATLRQRMAWLKATGIGGLVCNVSFKEYMRSEEQWRIFLTGLKAAEELGLHLWLYDEEGDPSGAAGGLVLERNSDLEAIGLARKTGADGKPRYEVQRMYEGTHCTENVYKKRRYVNLLNPLATRVFIEVTHEAYARRIPNLGRRVHAIFTDEPSLMTTYIRPPADALPALPWVQDLPQQFRRRKGYDLTPHLESLYTDTGKHQGVRCDFYEVVAQLVAERYFGQIQQWCRKHGVASSGHLLAEEKLLWHVMYYGDLFPCLRRMDIPGIDILASDPLALAVGEGFLVPKLISSAAHIMGRTETMSETSDFHEQMGGKRATLQQMKATASLQYLLGINTITSYYPDPYGATHPNNTEQRRADYAQYNAHVGRLSLLLRGAQHECDVAVLYPIAGVQANFYPTTLSMYQPHPSRRLNEIDAGFVNLCRWLLQHQMDFDILDEAAIQKAQIGRRQFRVAKERYRALVIPTTDAIHVATLQQ
ncbi:MAG: glycosyl hydrolase, partial [Armatimonadota bacterium]|nr:glycosyl hydrolase [Armatimonadota bacterium]